MVKSRYKIIQLALIIFVAMFIMIMAIFLYKTTRGPISASLMFLIVGFVGFAVYLTFNFFQRSPIITLDDGFITAKYPFNSRTYDWQSVKDVFFSKKEYYSVLYIMGQSLEATTISFDNGEKLVLWQDIYSNLDQLRTFISSKSIGKIRDPSPNISSRSLVSINRRRYAGNVYTSLNTIIISGMTVFMAFVMKSKLRFDSTLFIPIGLILFLFFLFGTQMNYFLIDNGVLFIKNHYFPWVNKLIDLKDIEEVDIETPKKRSTGLRIITKNFNSKIYGGGSLRDSNWKELLSDFKTIGIPARDDRDVF